jgi:DNA-binding SARP family transcriptional activator
VRIQLLGPIEYLSTEGGPVDLGHARQRCVFAVLALNANELVMPGDLIERVWGADPPFSSRNMIHTYISRLRSALRKDDGKSTPVLTRRYGGYLLEVEPELVDLHHFRHLVAAARSVSSDIRKSVGYFREAFRIWNGRALSGISGEWSVRTRNLLELEKLSAMVECHECELRLGRHAGLIDELHALADEQPENEMVIRNLMTALYRTGRQAEALEGYETLRKRLANHLGVDPAPETQELYTRILHAHPSLTITAAPDVVQTVSHAPRQLPRNTRFVGRDQELATLDGFVAADPEAGLPIRIIEGPPGVGKTALALHWARRVAHRFPDGQIFVNLYGSARSGRPLTPREAMRFVLWSLGIAEPVVGAADYAELYRTAIESRRVLVVMDDAAGIGQIAPLLPGASACAVVVTTGSTSLRDLDARAPALYVRLAALTRHEATQMLAGILGDARVDAEPEALTHIVELCERVPQALTSAAEHAVGRPKLALADLATMLSQER